MYFPTLHSSGKIPCPIAFLFKHRYQVCWQVLSPEEIHKLVVMFSFYEVLLLTSSMILIYARSTCLFFFQRHSYWYSKEFNMSPEFRLNRLDSITLVYRKDWDSMLAYLMKANAYTRTTVSINTTVQIIYSRHFVLRRKLTTVERKICNSNPKINKFNRSKIFTLTLFCASYTC